MFNSKRSLMRKLVITFLILCTLSFILLGALILSPSLRAAVFNIATELPTVATYYSIRQHIHERNFSASALGLNRQLSVVQMAGTRRNTFVRGLIKNTKIVMGVADYASDYKAMLPFLKRFVADQPELFITRIWLAQALSHSDPASAFPHLKEAVRLVPSDDRAYRIAVRAALALKDAEKARVWCTLFASAKFGGTRPVYYRNIFSGTGTRKLALEIPRAEGSPLRLLNEGVVMGSSNIYTFDLPDRATPSTLHLHLGLMPGVRVSLNSVILYGPLGKQTLSEDDLIILPREGFVLTNGKILTVSPDGDVLTLRRKTGVLGPIDRIDIQLTFDRSGLATLPGCKGV